jgi:hypothetical protein
MCRHVTGFADDRQIRAQAVAQIEGYQQVVLGGSHLVIFLKSARAFRAKLCLTQCGSRFALALSMTTYRKTFACTFLSLCGGLSACSATDEFATPELEQGTASQPFSTFPGEPNHEDITAVGLAFLRPEILTAIQVGNVATDVEFHFVNANHFDDCNFSGGSQVVQSSQAEAVAQFDPSVLTPDADLLAARAFGRSLHALQDFYAHTNWIELGGEVLVDSSSVAFPTLDPYSTISSSGFIVVQGAKPKHAALNQDEDAPYPTNAIVTVKLDKTRAPGLMSGTVDYEPGNFCPASVAMTHEELNKDKSTLVDRVQQYEAAKALAILQTEHEWCRLRGLTRIAWGELGVARLDTWVAEGASAPACD